MNIIVLGPTAGEGGITTVINTVVNTEVLCKENIFRVSTSVYKDGGTVKEILTLVKGFYQYLHLLLRERIDIIHIHSSYQTSFYRKSIFAFTGQVLSKKVLFHLHSSEFDSFFVNQKNRCIRFLIVSIMKRNTMNIVLCNDWKMKLTAAYGFENVISIRNPTPLLLTRRILPEQIGKKVTFLFMGFYIPSKGILDLIEAASILVKEGVSNFSVVICGKGNLDNEINGMIRALNLESIVTNAGWVTGEEKKRRFKDADVFVLPSYREGMPIVILEAFSFGLPVISTRIAGIPEIIEDGKNGFLIEPGDVMALAKNIQEMILDKEMRNRIAEQNYKHAEYFAAGKIAKEWKDVYKACIE
jgi:glycosyltransferase involved in cell wall biosynthesis